MKTVALQELMLPDHMILVAAEILERKYQTELYYKYGNKHLQEKRNDINEELHFARNKNVPIKL